MTKTPPDSAAFMREMLGQWETIATEFGSGLLKSGEFARTVNNATTAGEKARSMGGEVITRALAAANMPSREELALLTARVAAIETSLARIEALLTPMEKPAKIKGKKKSRSAD